MQDSGADGGGGRKLVRPRDWRARIEARLANTRPRHAVEDWLTPGLTLPESRALQAYFPTSPIPAAVLVPLIEREDELTVLLTQRASQLKNHAGQISFPGGRIEPEDAGPREAALREAHEEIGLDAALVEPLGYVDLYFTFTGFRILPVVARVAPTYMLDVNPSEVADAFEVPLDFLMRPENHQRRSRDWKGIQRHYYEMPYEQRYIWGVTAGILRNLYERLYGV